MNRTLKRATLSTIILLLSIWIIHEYIYKNIFIGNYYSRIDGQPIISFYEDYQGLYFEDHTQNKYSFNWNYYKEDTDYKLIMFNGDIHPKISLNYIFKNCRTSIIKITTGKYLNKKNLKSTFNNDELYYSSLNSDNINNSIQIQTKKSIFLDIANHIKNEYSN